MNALFRLDPLALFISGGVVVFTVLTLVYSTGFMRGRDGLGRYYFYLLLTGAAAVVTALADNFLLFIAGWGVLGLLLYLLIGFGGDLRASYTAKKALIIVGGTDSLMLLGLALLWRLQGADESPAAFSMSTVSVPLIRKAAVVAYLCLLSGALAKAGAMPFHTWVPDTAENAPTPVAAFLPASLDKLLGIYFLVRLNLDLFQMTPAANTLLMALGSVTILGAVLMALVQHDLKRLLGYHAVSQVGYMVLGIGTGNPIGIAGGLFHMLNNVVYKTLLFFAGGNVENRAGTTDLDKLGGLSKAMPITFGAFFVGALAISGVPPLNGFASKWMVYQGVVESGARGYPLWFLWLAAAMLGSALTLASFMKLLHAVFLGRPSEHVHVLGPRLREVGPALWLPPVFLAAFCVVFGVFAFALPLPYLIAPSLGFGLHYVGTWHPVAAAVLILISLGAGLGLYLLGGVFRARTVDPFVGGEVLDEHPEMRNSGVDFYDTVKEYPGLRSLYAMASRKLFDVYDVGRYFTLCVSKGLGFFHNGVLPRYLAWCLLGILLLFYVLRRGWP